MCDNFVLNMRLQGLIHQKSLFQALYMTETDKEREDGVLGMSLFSRERSGTRQGGLVTTPQRKFENALGHFFFNPFNSQDLISNSLYCLPYSSCDLSLENLVLDQLIIS